MSNLKLILKNTADTATLEAIPEAVPTLPVSALQNGIRGFSMRSTGVSQTLLGDHSEPVVIDGVALDRHNFTNLATIRVRLFSENNQAGQVVYDSGSLVYGDLVPAGEFSAGVDALGGSYDTEPVVCVWFAPVIFRSFEIVINDPDNEAGFLQIERLIMGRAFSPQYNFSWGSQLQYVDLSTVSRTSTGGSRSRYQPGFRRLSLSLDWVTGFDRDRFSSEMRSLQGADVFVCAYPAAGGAMLRDYTMSARIVGGYGFTHNRQGNFQVPLVFEEA